MSECQNDWSYIFNRKKQEFGTQVLIYIGFLESTTGQKLHLQGQKYAYTHLDFLFGAAENFC